MVVTPKNLIKHELIHLTVKVVESTDASRIGVKGEVVGETKNTLKVLSEGKVKILPKEECTFLFELGKEIVEVKGKELLGRPEDRTKKRIKKW